MTCRTFSSSPGVFSADSFCLSTAVSFLSVPPTSLRRLPNDGSVLPACNVQYACRDKNNVVWSLRQLQYNLNIITGWHPSRHVLTVASNTKKFDSGILKALNLASSPSPSRALSSPGNTKLSTGHLRIKIGNNYTVVIEICLLNHMANVVEIKTFCNEQYKTYP